MNATLPTYEELCARKPNTVLVTKKQSPFAMRVKDFFTIRKWKTLYSCPCKARVASIFGETYKVSATAVIRLTTNLNHNVYQCYVTDGMQSKEMLDINVLIAERPEVVRILNMNNCAY